MQFQGVTGSQTAVATGVHGHRFGHRLARSTEHLLVWTYRDQRADRVAGVGLLLAAEASAAGEPIRGISGDGTAALEMIDALGCRIDGGLPDRRRRLS